MCRQTQSQVLFFLASIPVRASADTTTLAPELSQLLKDGFDFINHFYLEFESKRDAKPACMNLLGLNFDNFMEVNEDSRVGPVTYQMAKAVVNREAYKSILPENIRMLAVELSFI